MRGGEEGLSKWTRSSNGKASETEDLWVCVCVCELDSQQAGNEMR